MNKKTNKIAIINPFGGSLGHSELYASNICQSLADMGEDVTLFTSSDYKYAEVLGNRFKKFNIESHNNR